MASKLHSMMCTIRSIKAGPEQNKLKASPHGLPRLEPWMAIVNKANPTLLTLIANKNCRRHEAIMSRGERGDGRDFKPISFLLNCPHCGTTRECAKVRLFDSRARCLNCATCRRNTTSTRWSCQHGLLWQHCTSHREQGFSCGTSSPPSPTTLKGPAPSKPNSDYRPRPGSWESWGKTVEFLS